jgi:two-component system, chemotaxis family, response regulator Rcp1
LKRIHILLAEDNRGDSMLIEQALQLHQVAYTLHVVEDGEKAIDFVTGMGKPGASPCPDIVLLDLNLPRVDGPQVLRKLRNHPECAKTPVIIVSSSDSSADRESLKDVGPTLYFTKPLDLDEFLKLGLLVRQVVEGQVSAQQPPDVLPDSIRN